MFCLRPAGLCMVSTVCMVHVGWMVSGVRMLCGRGHKATRSGVLTLPWLFFLATLDPWGWFYHPLWQEGFIPCLGWVCHPAVEVSWLQRGGFFMGFGTTYVVVNLQGIWTGLET